MTERTHPASCVRVPRRLIECNSKPLSVSLRSQLTNTRGADLCVDSAIEKPGG